MHLFSIIMIPYQEQTTNTLPTNVKHITKQTSFVTMKFTIFCFQYFFLEFYSYICVDVEFSEHYDTMLQLKEKKE